MPQHPGTDFNGGETLPRCTIPPVTFYSVPPQSPERPGESDAIA